MPSYYEFFSGGGMARLGLSEDWQCTFANDICSKKVSTYIDNFGDEEIVCDDIYNIDSQKLPNIADLMWASFPCQDLSLAGNGSGLNGSRSGTFNKVVDLLTSLKKEKRSPKVIVLENVVGAITSHQGNDFVHIINSLTSLGYRVGCMVIDGALFVPQSRPRLFIVGTLVPKKNLKMLSTKMPNPMWHPENLIAAFNKLPKQVQRKWVWWKLPPPVKRETKLVDILEDKPTDVEPYSKSQIESLIKMMSAKNLEKVQLAKQSNRLIAGGLYKRIRKQSNGDKLQRAEVRFDGIAGCLRTPTGGSSRQTLLLVNGEDISARLVSKREAARLMGVPENYILPARYNDAYHVFGDGLVVPAVSWLENHILSPLNKI